MGGGVGFGGSKSKNSANQSSTQNVWGPQGDALTDLYNSARGTFDSGQRYNNQIGNMAGQIAPYMQDAANMYQGGIQNLLGGGSYGDASEIRNQLMSSIQGVNEGGSQMGKMYQSITGGPGNEYIDPMVAAMKRSADENLKGMQSGNALNAAAMGQGGSSKHGVLDYNAAKDMSNEVLDREMALRGGAYDKDMQMKMDIARQADQGIQGGQDRLLSMLQGTDANVQAGAAGAPMMQNLGMGQMAPLFQAMNAPWMQQQQYSDIIGGPTVLTDSQGQSSGSSKSMGGQGSASLKG